MNEEYLWNRQGDDDDITRLEEILSAFKYVPTAAPTIQTSRGRGWLWRAIPISGAAVLAIAVIVWSIGIRRPQSVAVSEAPQVVAVVEKMPVVTKGEAVTTNPMTADKPRMLRAVYNPRGAVAPTLKQSSRSTPVTFTAEEKQAYQQVLLALYITGSQLKSVNDAIDGIEKKGSENR